MYTHDIAISLPVRLVRDRFNFNPFPSSVTLRAVASSSSGVTYARTPRAPVRSASTAYRYPRDRRKSPHGLIGRGSRFRNAQRRRDVGCNQTRVCIRSTRDINESVYATDVRHASKTDVRLDRTIENDFRSATVNCSLRGWLPVRSRILLIRASGEKVHPPREKTGRISIEAPNSSTSEMDFKRGAEISGHPAGRPTDRTV